MSTPKKQNAFMYLIMAFMLLILMYAFKKNRDYNRLEDAFKQEQVELQNEFDELIDDYKDLSIKKKDLSNRLIKEINKIIALKDSVKNLKATNFSLIRKYRRRVASLERQNRTLFVKVDSLTLVNKNLKDENLATTVALTENKTQAKNLQKTNENLQKTNEELKEKVGIAGVIKTSPIKAIVMKERSSGKLTSTSRSSRADAFKVSFRLLENKVTTPGDKKIYVQIIDQNKNIIAPQGVTVLKDGNQIVYSQELIANYQNGSLDVLSLILVNRDDIHKGIYAINAYVDGHFTGTTAVKLR